MSKGQIALWTGSALSARVNVLEAVVLPVVYGSFSSTQTQDIPVADAGVSLTFDTIDTAQGCSLSGGNPTPKVEVSVNGVYRVLYSIQVNRNGGGVQSLFAYPIVNATPVPNSTTKMALNGNQEDCLTVEYILNLSANDLLMVHCWSGTAGQQALAIPSTDDYPAVPSIILTLNRIA